jgi:anti-anti-sigma regulatory factor
MEFKIDTNDNYTVITPLSVRLDENLTEALLQKWTELVNIGVNNVIIDINRCSSMDENVMDSLLDLHESLYSNDHSIVFTNVQTAVRSGLQKHASFHDINIAPTMEEAIDIISMETLERDLLSEEEGEEE